MSAQMTDSLSLLKEDAMSTLTPAPVAPAVNHDGSTVTYPVPRLYSWMVRNGIREAVKEISPVYGMACSSCADAILQSFYALVRTGMGSDDTFDSDMAALLGLDASEVTLNGWDDAPLETFTVPASVSQADAMDAVRCVFRGKVPSGGYSWGVAYQWAVLEMTDRVCEECGHGK